MITSETVKRANLEVYNRKVLEGYQENRSIFNPHRQQAIQAILRGLRERVGGGNYLDIGCGTGNLLNLARAFFEKPVGLDLARRLLAQVRRRSPNLVLAAGESERLPFQGNSFNVISLYAVLHHILDPSLTFQEAFRCLKTGGFLYTDHDPNYFFNRFYHIFYKLRHRSRPGFGSELEEIAEYHNTKRGGLNPDQLAGTLGEIGFRKVEVHYRLTDNEDLPFPALLSLRMMRWLSRLIPSRSLFTHFWIVAQK